MTAQVEREIPCRTCDGSKRVGTGEYRPTYDVDEFGFAYRDGEEEILEPCRECSGTGFELEDYQTDEEE